MTPNITASATGPLFEEDLTTIDTKEIERQNKEKSSPEKRKIQPVWRNIILFAYLHIAALYGVYLCFTSARLYTILFAILLYKFGGLGITAGAHRLWAHRSYKAKWPLRVFLMMCNTAAHLWGPRPYDKFINPSENLSVSLLAMGEGWHNYHHTFPWDYKTSELGRYATNETAAFIDFCAKLGLVYERKTVPQEMVKRRVERTGDGTHELWGWGDKDQTAEERAEAIVLDEKKDE
ncbi:Desaturase 1 [Carabus blaptoides fortunei]